MLSKKRFIGSLSPIVLSSLILLLISGCGHPQLHTKSLHTVFTDRQSITPPVAKVIPKTDTLHGEIRIDDYYWLRNRSNSEVIEYLEEENEYTEAVMKHTEKFQEQLYKELLSRIKEIDLSVPDKIDNYYYYKRTEEGKQYPIYCRKKGSLDAEEEILLDQNELAAGHTYFEIGLYKISPNHKFLIYSVDTTGSEIYTLYFKDLDKDELFTEEIPNSGYSAAWANNNKTIYYTILDSTRRPYKLYRHILGTDSEDDIFIYHEKDKAFFLYISMTKNKEYLIMDLGSHTTSEVHYLISDNPTGDFKVIHPRQPEMEYYVESYGDRFFIMTNDQAKNFKLMQTSVNDPSRENRKEVIPHRDSVKIDSFDIFKNHLVVYEKENGLEKIRITNLVGGETHYINFPEPVYTFWRPGYTIWPEKNRDFNSNMLRFTYTSLVTPRSVFDYNMDNRTRELKKQYEVLGGYDPSMYQSKRIFAKVKDGTMIPISLVYKKGMKKDGNSSLYLIGYGAYGESSDPYFSSIQLSLLDRGFIYAIAHIRGGGEMGRYWYEQGKLLHKKNTFSDFIACAEYLINEKYTSNDKLVITGGSAGGLLIGAVTNMRSDLFKIVVADVPFVDLINTMLDPTLPLTVLEYEEWGNPNNKEYYDYMKSYSPYDNVAAKEYPSILITAGLNDSRVQYWEAAKWTAKLRALKTDKNILLLKTEMGAGHMGASGRYDYLKDIAFLYAFIFDLFGIEK
ncbi:S9 family peptidase [candidate division WOR-3 bacterium]|nr:S9 family peptidase [candidate division WOR-3 bacterium]